MVTVLVWSVGAFVLAGLLWMIGLVVAKGAPGLRPSFFTQDLSTVGPLDPGGGALHAIIGTLEQVGIAVVVVVPIAILTAVYLHELRGRMAPVIRFVTDAMSGLPSIVAGLLVFTVYVDGRGFSGLAGSIALLAQLLAEALKWTAITGGGRRGGNRNDGPTQIIGLIAMLLVIILAPIAATIIQLAISRKREFVADAGAAELTRYPQGLASALAIMRAGTSSKPISKRKSAITLSLAKLPTRPPAPAPAALPALRMPSRLLQRARESAPSRRHAPSPRSLPAHPAG